MDIISMSLFYYRHSIPWIDATIPCGIWSSTIKGRNISWHEPRDSFFVHFLNLVIDEIILLIIDLRFFIVVTGLKTCSIQIHCDFYLLLRDFLHWGFIRILVEGIFMWWREFWFGSKWMSTIWINYYFLLWWFLLWFHIFFIYLIKLGLPSFSCLYPWFRWLIYSARLGSLIDFLFSHLKCIWILKRSMIN